MPKKKRKSKSKRKSFKKKKNKLRKKSSLRKKVSKKKSKIKKNRSQKRKSSKIKKQEDTNQNQELIFKTRPEWIKSSLANKSQYQNKYNDSIKNNNAFWKKEGKRITWIKPYKKIKDVKYSREEVRIKWLKMVP